MLAGNDLNQFRWRLDAAAAWTAWSAAGQPAVTIELSGIDTGNHALAIQTCYHPNSKIVDSKIPFFRVSRPWVIDKSPDMQIKEQCACTLWVLEYISGLPGR